MGHGAEAAFISKAKVWSFVNPLLVVGTRVHVDVQDPVASGSNFYPYLRDISAGKHQTNDKILQKADDPAT